MTMDRFSEFNLGVAS